ncbi:MAG: nuclear transport factor 2 family protein [Tannerellaceae bacterium]|jgi:hypothetical protein|nr:nuclear transport factor 2 family protein [Tannerellaceae bacterium]
MKYYSGTVPTCGIYCGSCPQFGRCKGAICATKRCGIYKCCVEKRGHRHCFECKTFPCSKLGYLAERRVGYGQDIVRNLRLIKELGEPGFFDFYSAQIDLMRKQADAEHEAIVRRFNDCINKRNIKGLTALMTDDHVFVDTAGNRIIGVADNRNLAWTPFFERFPGYRNVFEIVIVNGSRVVIQGYSVCPGSSLDNFRAIWVAEVSEKKISLWSIYPDTGKNRKLFGLNPVEPENNQNINHEQ